MRYIHTKYCCDISDLRDFLRKLHSEELVTVTQEVGYTVIWKSDEKYDLR
ncbi:hypothetical protein ABMB67_001528 [Halalkalibacter oceani]